MLDAYLNLIRSEAAPRRHRTGRRVMRADHLGTGAAHGYPLHDGQDEFKRLERQAAFFRDLTEDVLRRASIDAGMRVLDVGCGVGDVSLLLARRVGASGLVVGVDRSAEAIAVAQRRASAAGYHWMRFAVSDLDSFATGATFHAVTGRLVLMYMADPVAILRRLSRHLCPGGVVAMQEMAMPLARSVPEGPLYGRCRGWILETFERTGIELDMGSRLFAVFRAAGLPEPRLIAAARVEGGADSPIYDYMAGTLSSLLPAMERLGVATAAEVGVDTLAARLREEAVELGACLMAPPLIGAWARQPA